MLIKYYNKFYNWWYSYDETYYKIEKYHKDNMQKYIADFSKVEQEYIVNYGDWGPFESQRLQDAVNEKQFNTEEEKTEYEFILSFSALTYSTMESRLERELIQYQSSKKWIRMNVI